MSSLRIPSSDELAARVYHMRASQPIDNTLTDDIDVSVVTVCFNPLKAGRRELFYKNMQSVQEQEGVRLEHLIIDGASTDGTYDWLTHLQNTRYDIRILSEPDSGIYEAMNKGIALARGKYIIYLNSDDFFHNPLGMAASVARLEELRCDFSFAPIRFSENKLRHNPQLAPHKRLYRFIIGWCFSHQTMLTSRSKLLSIDGFDTSYKSAADYDLLLRLIVNDATGCFVPLTFSTFTLGGFSFSEENTKAVEDECIRCLQNFYKDFYAVEMTYDEVEFIFRKHIYPHKYIKIYKQSQELIRKRFIGTPKGPVAWLSWWFNYYKYYLRCIKAKDNLS